MRQDLEQCVKDIGVYLVESKDTVRGAAAKFGCSKSTVHKYMTERLEQLDPGLYRQVRDVLDVNKAQRHLRGGEATKRKYAGDCAESADVHRNSGG